MPPVTGEPQLGAEEAEDILKDEKGRPPDEIYEDGETETSSRFLPSASTSMSTKIFAKDSEQSGPFTTLKRVINRSWQRSWYRPILGQSPSEDEKSGKSEHTFQQQRARLVHGIWASIENVCKVSSSLVVNKPQCEHIADHFKVTGDVLQKLGLGKDFVSGKVLEGGSGSRINFDFDETRFNHIAETFEKHFDEHEYLRASKFRNWSRKPQKYIRELPAVDGSREESLSAQSKINVAFQDFSPWGIMSKEIVDAQLGHWVQHGLDKFLHTLFGVLKHGEDLVLFHVGLEGANNGVAERTGLSGEKFVEIHVLLYEFLDHYAYLEHCEGSEFGSGYLSRVDVCEAKSILYYWDLNFRKEDFRLDITDDFLTLEMATKIANVLMGPNHALKKLSIKSSPRVNKVDQEELRKCRLMIIAALSVSMGLTSLTVHALNGKEVHDLCMSLRANRVLKKLVISTDGPLADKNAMDLSVMLEENHSLKSFTLKFDDVSPEGIVHLGAMLTEVSVGEIYLKSRGLSRASLNFLKKNASLVITDNFLSIEMATKIAILLKGPNHALKTLSIESSAGVEVDQEELRKCRLMIIAALSVSMGLTSFTVHALNGKEVHDLCMSLRANRVLKTLVISTDGPIADNNAMDLRTMLQENRSLKSFTLKFDDVSHDGIVYLGAMLTEISVDEIYLKSRGLSRVHSKYLLGLMMASIDGKRNVIFSLVDNNPEIEIWRFSCDGRELPLCCSYAALKLCVIKKHHNLSMEFADLDPDAVCEILDSLKKNKTLQQLDLLGLPRDRQKHGNNHQLAASLEALLVENSSLRVLKVHFTARDKHLVSHLLRPLMAEKDGESPVNNSLVQLHITYSDAKFSTNECAEVIKSIVQMICSNKTLIEFSTFNVHWRTSDICEMVDSLKTNKVLQTLHLDGCEVNAEVKVAFIDLLVNYNFTLSMISMIDLHGSQACYGMETFMKTVLAIDTKKPLRGLQSLVCTSSDSPIVDRAHDLKEVVATISSFVNHAVGLFRHQRSEGSTKEVCGSSKRALDEHKSEKETKDERPRIFVSYSNEGRDITRLLCEKLESSNYNVLDQDSNNFAELVDQCQLAIVVLSDMYVKSKPLMSKLCTIVNSKKTNNPTLKVYPVFYKLTLQDLQNAYVHDSTFGGEGSSLDFALEREGLNFLCEGKNEVSRKANDLVENLSQDRVDVGKFCEEFNELQRNSWPSNGLEFEKNAISEEENVHTILEEIFHYMPPTKDWNSDKTFGHQGKLEIESKLSLRHMKPLLESLPMTDFYLLRKFNMAQPLQEKYIQYSSFEKMCPLDWSCDEKLKFSKGRIAAALFPTTFLYHFKVSMFQDIPEENFRPVLKAVAALVVEKMQKEYMQNEVKFSAFVDIVDCGASLDPSKMIAMCQNFSAKTSDGSKQLVIVQDDLTQAYHYQLVDASNLRNLAVDETIGVIGVQVESKEIYVDNIHEDGSSYSGVLGDFSYKFDFGKNKQCAAQAFGDRSGAEFLSENIGIKCSPLLIIALASAIQRKGLTLTWSNGKGHMQFDAELAPKVEVDMEPFACLIQYTSNIKQLGLEIEWGTSTMSCAPLNHTCQTGKMKVVDHQEVFSSNMDQNMATSSSRNGGTASTGCVSSMPERDIINAAIYAAAAQNKKKSSVSVNAGGFGVAASWEKHGAEAKKLLIIAAKDILKHHYESRGGFETTPNLDAKYPNLVEHLCNGQLHEVHEFNYLVVYDNNCAGHVSVYLAIEEDEEVPGLDELIWITDVLIEGGEDEIKRIFDIGLKGRELFVKREGSDFSQVEYSSDPWKKRISGYKKLLSKFSKEAIKQSMTQIKEPNLVDFLKSKNEWEHIIGPRGDYGKSHTFWWSATCMQAIVYSRTRYSSGKLLKICTKLPIDAIGRIGFCSVEDSSKENFGHRCVPMESRGKFSRASGSLMGSKVLWGGLEIGRELLENSRNLP